MSKMSVLEKTYVVILMVIFGGIVLHTPATIFLSSFFPDYELVIKSWKEILMIVAGLMAVYLIYKNKRVDILKEPVIIFIALFALLNLLMAPFSDNSVASVLAGLVINLRYLLFFALVYIALKIFPDYKKLFIKIGVAGALLVCVFAFLQVFVLPKDILQHIGYNSETIYPYMTVDKNESFIRINSTLRGPNPVGAYAVMVLAMVVAFVSKMKLKVSKKDAGILSVLVLCGSVALISSYSRSAWIAAAVAVFIVLLLTQTREVIKKLCIVGATVLFVLIMLMATFAKSDFVSNIIFHDNPVSTSPIDSNDQHSESLVQGMSLMISQPFGAGIGSTGSASILDNKATIIENQYLFVAHESGWLGFVLFLSAITIIILELWKRRSDWFAIGVLASGIGLILIGFVLPVWADDTVSIIWWGSAAIALSAAPKMINDKAQKQAKAI